MKRVMMALGCAAVTMFAGCMCDQMAARDLQPKEAVECPEIRSECFSLLFENIATNRIELCGQHRFPERMTMRGDRPIAWKDIGSLSDAKKVEERYTTSVPPHLSPLGGLVPDIDIYKRMKEIRLASVSFRPPATLMDAVLVFQSASVPYDGSGEVILFAMRPAKTDEIYPPAPKLTAEDISFYDALKIVVESANARFWIRGDGVVVVEPKSWTCDDGCKPGDTWLLNEGSWPKAADGESMGASQNLKEGN